MKHHRSSLDAITMMSIISLLLLLITDGMLTMAQPVDVTIDAVPSTTPEFATKPPIATATTAAKSIPAAPASPSLPSGLTRQMVPTFELHDRSAHFANEIADRDLPLIIRGSNVDQWQAASWTPHALAKRLMNLRGVKHTTDVNSTFHYCYDSPLDTVEDVGPRYRQQCWTQNDMDGSDFATKLDGKQEDGRTYSYSTTTDQWDEAIEAEISPLETVMVLPPDYKPEDSHLYRQTVAWIGAKGATTQCHYDLSYNFFTQISGYKHFFLFPPNAWERLYPYPHIHPGRQASQVNFNDVDLTKFPNFAGGVAFEAVVAPGDVLFIPPLWHHHVTSLTPSISVSVWSHSAGAKLYFETIDKCGIPIMRTWTLNERIAALRLWLESVVDNIFSGSNAKLPAELQTNVASFVDWILLQNRYRYIGSEPLPVDVKPTDSGGGSDSRNSASTNDNIQRYCFDQKRHDKVLADANERFVSTLTSLVDNFEQIFQLSGEARRDIWLANYIELSIWPIVGAANVRQFLYDLCYC